MLDSNIPFTLGELWLMAGDGQNPIQIGSADAGHGYRPVWSPDGAYLALGANAGGEGMDIWVLETQSGQLKQVTHGASARHPTWLSTP